MKVAKRMPSRRGGLMDFCATKMGFFAVKMDIFAAKMGFFAVKMDIFAAKMGFFAAKIIQNKKIKMVINFFRR